MKKGFFLNIDGLDGSGKGLQIENIIKYLSEKDISFIRTREPGGTTVAEKIRDIIVNEDIDPITETYLFASARREHVKKVIKPALNEGKFIVCDRYVYSSLAYQGYARGLGVDFVHKLNLPAIEGCYPDKVIYLDLEPEIGLARINENDREVNRLDNEKIDFYRKCRECYLELAKKEPDRFIIINANQSPEEVFNDIKKVLKKLI